MTRIAFRNVEVPVGTPVSELPFEAVLAMIERNGLTAWRMLAAEIDRRPWGRVARIVEQIAGWDEHYGVDRLLTLRIERSRRSLTHDGRRLWASRIRGLRKAHGLTLDEMASMIGTSAPRLSNYENAKTAPTTDVLGRIELLIGSLADVR